MKGFIARFAATVAAHKTLSAILCGVLVLAVFLSVILPLTLAHSPAEESEPVTAQEDSSLDVSSDIPLASESEEASSDESSSEDTTSRAAVSKPAVTTNTVVPKSNPVNTGDFKYNTNLDIEDNVFLDALVYTGYNLAKHRADGNMWKYLLWTDKRWRGYLSNITYGGGSSGYETTASGKPDISFFERNGLVCASYATYVYFNYLPNVAGIDTSMLPRPINSRHANDWYTAVKKWVELGYSKSVRFTATAPSRAGCYITFKNIDEMPIGSVVIFRDASRDIDYGGHVAIYTGYKNGYHWLHQVGNSNGPEMCAIERMLFGPDPQWPLYIVTPPTNIRLAALLEVELKDDSGNAIAGVDFSLKNAQGTTVASGKTDANGRFAKEGLKYGTYTLTHTAPDGYTTGQGSVTVTLTSKNNSRNTVAVVDVKDKPPVIPEPEEPNEEPDDASQPDGQNEDDV